MSEKIGELIRESVKRSDKTQEDFAKEMGMTLRNVANLFNKEHVPIDQLIRASRILKEDFLKKYTQQLYDENPALKPLRDLGEFHDTTAQYNVRVIEPEISFSVNIGGELEKVQTAMPELIGIISKAAKERGLHLV